MAEPPVTVRAAHDSGTPNQTPTRYVVHCTAGGLGFPRESAAGRARGTADYFARETSGGSAHYVHDAGGAEEHCVPEAVIAWHAPPNQYSVGDEICGEPTYTRDQWLSPEVWPALQASARRCREVCDRYGIPKVKLSPADLLAGRHGICGHVDVSQAWHQSSHWDPGPNFPWDRYLAEVNGGVPVPLPPPPPAVPSRFAWPLPAGQYFGNLAGPDASHGGYYASEQGYVRNIQQWLIYHGCVPGIPSAAWAHSGWADGRWEDATDGAMRTWHARFYPNQPQPAQCWIDDYDHLARP